MKLQYRTTNAYSFMIVFDEDHAETYMMDGSEEFPIFDMTTMRDASPEEIETAARNYLKHVALYIENLSGADYEFEREEDEPIEDFYSRICVDDDHSDELIAEI